MTGFNLPPGCSVRDLPGNSREDEAAEAAYEQVCEHLIAERLIDPAKMEEPEYDQWVERLVKFIMMREASGHSAGYIRAVEEQREYEDIKEADALAKQYWKGEGR